LVLHLDRGQPASTRDGRQIVRLVVAERDLVADEVVDRADPVAHGQRAPPSVGDEPLDGRDDRVSSSGGAAEQEKRGVGHGRDRGASADGEGRISEP
jgi:hypothetical protein